jgi:hypothetical protein
MPVTFFLDVPATELEAWRALRPDREPQRLVLGEHYWIVLTWARLRAAGLAVQLDNRLPDAGVVVFYAGDKRAIWRQQCEGRSQALLVAVRSDRSPVGFADVEIVQNLASADGLRSLHVPHWPQPGLLPRDPARGGALRTVLFPGTPRNLHPEFLGAHWAAFLEARGLAFRSHFQADAGSPPAYQDFRDVDLMLALRPAAAAQAGNKPAWKLFNAWLAGVPALLGPETGYRELRQGPLDYLEIENPDQAMAAIDRLLEQPALYRAMVDNGLVRGQAFGTEATLARWQRLIEDDLMPRARAQLLQPVQLWKRGARDARARLRRVLHGAA